MFALHSEGPVNGLKYRSYVASGSYDVRPKGKAGLISLVLLPGVFPMFAARQRTAIGGALPSWVLYCLNKGIKTPILYPSGFLCFKLEKVANGGRR